METFVLIAGELVIIRPLGNFSGNGGKVQFAFAWAHDEVYFSCAVKPTWHPKPLHHWDTFQSFAPTVQTVWLTAVTVLKPTRSYCCAQLWPCPVFTEANSSCHGYGDFCHGKTSVYVCGMEILNNSLTIMAQKWESFDLLLLINTLICCSLNAAPLKAAEISTGVCEAT